MPSPKFEKGQTVRTKLRPGNTRPSVSRDHLDETHDNVVGTISCSVSPDKDYAWFVRHDQFGYRVGAYYPDELTPTEDEDAP